MPCFRAVIRKSVIDKFTHKELQMHPDFSSEQNIYFTEKMGIEMGFNLFLGHKTSDLTREGECCWVF